MGSPSSVGMLCTVLVCCFFLGEFKRIKNSHKSVGPQIDNEDQLKKMFVYRAHKCFSQTENLQHKISVTD